jgi:iron complex outermembrane receptor protein
LENRLQVNLELYYWKYRDAQEIFSFQNAAGDPAFGYTNAGQAKMYGFDLDVIHRLTEDDTIHGSVEYLYSRFDKFVYPSGGLSSATSACQLTNNPNGTQTVDCTGKPLIRSPKWSGTVGYDHVFHLSNGGTIDAAWSAQFASSRWGGVEYIPAVHFDGYISHDITVTYEEPDKKWQVAAFVRNLNDADVYTGSYDVPSLLPSLVVANLNPPRTFGMRLSVNF